MLRICARLRRSPARPAVGLCNSRHAARDRENCNPKRGARDRAAGLFILIAAVFLSSIGAADSNASREVRIAGAAYLGDLPTHVAEKRGLFADEGLQAKVHYSESGKQNLMRLRAGETDFALMALTPLVLDYLADEDRGRLDDPVILASLLQSYELTAVLAVPGTGIERPADLAGRRVGFERGANTEFVWWLFEQVHGIDPETMETVSLPFSRSAEAVFSNRVDAVVLPEPWALQLEARYRRIEDVPLQRFDIHNLYAGRWIIVTSRQHVHERRDACRKVLAAYRQASEWIENSPSEAISIYAGSTHSSSRILVERWQALDYDINLDWALVSSLQEQLRWAHDQAIATVAGPRRVLQLIEPGPLREILPDAVNIPQATTRKRLP